MRCQLHLLYSTYNTGFQDVTKHPAVDRHAASNSLDIATTRSAVAMLPVPYLHPAETIVHIFSPQRDREEVQFDLQVFFSLLPP